MKVCGIYCLTHSATGMKYIGQSIDVAARWRQHQKGRERSLIAAAIVQFGWPAFVPELLEVCDVAALNTTETAWIAKLGTLSPHGYNQRSGGGQCAAFSDEVRARISEATRKGLTPEVLARRRVAMTGIPKSAEWRAAMSERQRNPKNIERIAALARNQSAETRAKIAAAHQGKTLSAATRQKIADAAKADGRVARMQSSPNYLSAQTRVKMSAAAKARSKCRGEGGRFA